MCIKTFKLLNSPSDHIIYLSCYLLFLLLVVTLRISNIKATIYLFKLFLGFKSILHHIPSTQHAQACVFKKITVQNWYFFTSSCWRSMTRTEYQVKNSVLKSRNRCDQVIRTKSFWCMTRFWFLGPGHGQGRQNTP